MELTCTEWVSVETTNTPCVNELGIKGKTIGTKDVDGVILKHWVTFSDALCSPPPDTSAHTFLTLEGEQSMQTFWKKTGRELYRRTTLTETKTRETTDQVTRAGR